MKSKNEATDKKYEEDILSSFERGEWQSVPNLQNEIDRYASNAATTLSKDKRINIRVSSRDLEDIQMRAAEEGMPYQTLIASVLHKFVSGRFVEAVSSPTMSSTPTARKRSAG